VVDALEEVRPRIGRHREQLEELRRRFLAVADQVDERDRQRQQRAEQQLVAHETLGDQHRELHERPEPPERLGLEWLRVPEILRDEIAEAGQSSRRCYS
jgi:hypothetical protein